MDNDPQLHVETATTFADWLATHHATAPGVWVVSWRRLTGRPAPGYEDLVVEALRYGWVDSLARTLDDDRRMQRFSPRRRGSGWARPNKQRIARLEAEDRLEPAGAAVVAQAREDGSWTLLDGVEALEVPDDLAGALAAAGARDRWDTLTRSVRKRHLTAIVQAKRTETRSRRIQRVVDEVASSSA